MFRSYHQRLQIAADSAVATGRVSSIYFSMLRSSAIWTLPAIAAVMICGHMGLGGIPSLYVCLPLILMSVAGCCGYVGWVYWRAMMRDR
jgi:hypothetical protein